MGAEIDSRGPVLSGGPVSSPRSGSASEPSQPGTGRSDTVKALIPILGEEAAMQAIDALELAARRWAGPQQVGCITFDVPYGRLMRLIPSAKPQNEKPD